MLLFNPFIRIAGVRSLLAGVTGMLLAALIAYHSHCHFDGVLDAHVGSGGPWWLFLAEPFLAWGTAVLVFYIAGRLVASSGTRLVDIAGTMAIARLPMIFVALLCFIPVKIPLNAEDISAGLVLQGLAMLLFAIWMIALMYHAYRVSSGAKGNKAILSFILALLLAEILSKVLCSLLYARIPMS